MTLRYNYWTLSCRLALMALLSLSVQVVVVVAVELEDNKVVVDHARAQVEWLQSEQRCGGYFNENKLRFDPPRGLFATSEISKGEMLIIIPRQCLLTADTVCGVVERLLAEHRLGDESQFAPYVNYLYDGTQRGLVPSAWSEAGKELITDIWGDDLLPYSGGGLTDLSYADYCGGGSGDSLEEHTFMMVYSRCWDETCVPVFDMVNHRNGPHYNNVDSNSVHRGVYGLFVFATRDIQKGEQIYFSYNWCTDCGHLGNTNVAPHIFRDYGFVEQYPRRWLLYDKNGNELLFDLDYEKQKKKKKKKKDDPNDENENDELELELTWLSEEPDSDQVQHLQWHSQRLQSMKEDVSRRAAQLDSEHERNTSLELYQALIEALEHAIDGGDDDAAAEDDDDDEESGSASDYDGREDEF